MNKYVEQFADQGIPIFPCYPDKAPATPNGFKDATRDKALLDGYFPEGVDRAVGMPTGNVSGFVVIDYDINKPLDPKDKEGPKDTRTVDELKEAVENILGIQLPPTVEVETQSGGRHSYYKLEEETTLASGTRVFDQSLPVDIRSNGGYICTVDGTARYTVYDDVDDLGITNLRDRCAVCPPEIFNFKKRTFEESLIVTDYEAPPIDKSEVAQLRAALAWIPSDDRDNWVNYGMALKYIGQGDSLKGLWVEWSQKSTSYDPQDIEKRWATLKPRGDIKFGTIIKHAQSLGFVSMYYKPEDPNIVTISNEKIEQQIEAVVRKREPFPKELLRPDGFMGELIDFIGSQAVKDQPILTLAGVIAFCGMLLGRKVEGDTGLRTNLYVVGLGETGCGKDNIRATIMRMMQEYDKNKFHATCSVEDVTSDSSIYKTLAASPSQLFLIDEMGMFLNTTTNSTANPYLYGIQKALLKLYSSSNQICFGKTYVDTKNNIELNNPHLCIYGNANPTQFYNSLTKDNVSDGLVSRFLFLESEDPDPEINEIIRMPTPQHIIQKIDYLYKLPTNIQPAGNLDPTQNVMPLIVPKTQEAKETLKAFNKEIRVSRQVLRSQKRIDVVYNRGGLSAEKLALIYACTEDVYKKNPIIEQKHILWGINVVRYILGNMQYAVEYHVWESDYEKNLKKILQFIRESGAATATEVALMSQYLDERRRNDIMSTLQQCKLIKEEFAEPLPGEKQSRKIYIPIHFQQGQ